MSLRLRSSSVGSKPRPRLQRTSRAESAAALALDVRCACQYYETNSLLPERVNPVGYNAAEEFEPCVHIHARLKEIEHQQQQQQKPSKSDIRFVQVPINEQPLNMNTQADATPPHSKVYEIPPEFAPENLYTDNSRANKNFDTAENAFGNRSASCANVDASSSTPQFMKQRDPSTSSLLRKRMSEERQGFSVLNKLASESTSSRDRFIQKDPSESTILRRKMSNRLSGSFERANSDRNQQPFHYQSTRIPNERTFYRDSDEFTRINSDMNVDDDVTESPSLPEAVAVAVAVGPSSTPPQIDAASPLSMQAQGNRRFVLSSTENLPQQIDEYMKTSVETEPDSGIDSNIVDEPQPRKTDNEKQMLTHDRNLRNQNVSDEEKVQILLSKSNTENLKPTEGAKQPLKLQLMNMEDVKMEMPVRTQVQYQNLAKADNMVREQEAEISDYSYSKLFDSYKSTEQLSLAQGTIISTPDLHLNYVKQRDPSSSPLIQNRYKAKMHEISVPPNMTIVMEMKTTNHDRLLPSAGDLPDRRASDVFRPQPNQVKNLPYIRQKDLRNSNVLNRRRRNSSQSSLGQDIEMADSNGGQPTKITKTISFEKNLSNTISDEISPYTGMKIVKGVSFEHNNPIQPDRGEQNKFDALQLSANRRPFR